MIHQLNVSAKLVSWVKTGFENPPFPQIDNLYYPETTDEFESLILHLLQEGKEFEIIGQSSNTLFLPSFRAENVICTTKLNRWEEIDNLIICECGVNVAHLSRQMVNEGYEGFEGLTDLPGTIAAGIYGNAGCRGCSLNSLVESFILLLKDGTKKKLLVNDLALRYRSTSLKRKEIDGVILSVTLRKNKSDAGILQRKAEENHQHRLTHQPSGANNLGTTFIGGGSPTLKGRVYRYLLRILKKLDPSHDAITAYKRLLIVTFHKKYIPYLFDWNRYMFVDDLSHKYFERYYSFLKSLDKRIELEIEIRR